MSLFEQLATLNRPKENTNAMYNLTDFSIEELRLMAEMINSRMIYEEGCSKINRSYGDDEVTRIIQTRYDATIAKLKEMNVRVLTSLQIVKERETVISN
jgi:ethanolamine ammonia-lyase large subunit